MARTGRDTKRGRRHSSALRYDHRNRSTARSTTTTTTTTAYIPAGPDYYDATPPPSYSQTSASILHSHIPLPFLQTSFAPEPLTSASSYGLTAPRPLSAIQQKGKNKAASNNLTEQPPAPLISPTLSGDRAKMAGHFGHDYESVPFPQTRGHPFEMDDHHYTDGNGMQQLNDSHDNVYHHQNVSGEQSPYLHENPFNRNSYYDSAYPEIAPSPARLSRQEFDHIDPNSIADDEDPAEVPQQRQASGLKRFSRLPIGGAAAMEGSGHAAPYSHVGPAGSSDLLAGAGAGGAVDEKAAWRSMEEMDRRRRKRIMWIVLAVVAVLVVAGAVVGGILAVRKTGSSSKSSNSGSGGSSSSSSGGSGASPGSDSGLTSSSSQIKALLNNPNLHKVFPVMDYTPYNTQWPACLDTPPSQDNVTMDMAILSQLTPSIRFYGTDCNQTQMGLTAIDRLGLNDTMKVWLGVWIGNNQTVNDRQLSQMYEILKTYPVEHFEGVIVGNEVLFRQDQTEAGLIQILNEVKANFTNLGIKLSVSTSDLGSSWNQQLAAASDHVMGNIHPFFAGVPADGAAAWTWVYWQGNDVAIAPESASSTGSVPRNIISETGWPSAGGNDCGTNDTCSSSTVGSVAGISEMNTFMDQWVCQANANGTMYFWFEAFDEPWKVIFDTPGEEWEDKWGLLTADRKLKDGLVIPNCGGKTLGR
ncbi:hypothetical protein ANO11243_033700 [Dothideomycetidae sp. 11243]|nr:hypothetical protein ANO11243_033700 [fungal sp. No.11243]